MTSAKSMALTLAALATGLLFAPFAHAASSPHGTLVFQDDFSGATVDTSKWWVASQNTSFQEKYRNGIFLYDSPAVGVRAIPDQPGARELVITAERGDFVDQKTGKHFMYRTGEIASRNIRGSDPVKPFGYGYFEIVARLPKGAGFWPALWLRTNPSQPLNGEVDLIEGFGSETRAVQSTRNIWVNGKKLGYNCAIFKTTNGPISRGGCGGNIVADPKNSGADLSQTFHSYALEWKPGELDWYFDGYKYFTITDNVPDPAKQPMVLTICSGLSSGWDPGPITLAKPTFEIKSVKVWSAL